MALQSNYDHIKGLLWHQTISSTVDNPPSQLLAEKQTQNSLEKKKCIDPHAVFTSTTDSSTLAATQKVVDLHLRISTATARKLGDGNLIVQFIWISGKSEQSSWSVQNNNQLHQSSDTATLSIKVVPHLPSPGHKPKYNNWSMKQ